MSGGLHEKHKLHENHKVQISPYKNTALSIFAAQSLRRSYHLTFISTSCSI